MQGVNGPTAASPKSLGNVFVTSNNGGTWAAVADANTGGTLAKAIMATRAPSDGIQAFSAFFRPQRAGWIYVTTTSHGIWYSTDDGTSWQEYTRAPFVGAHRLTFDETGGFFGPSTFIATFGYGVMQLLNT